MIIDCPGQFLHLKRDLTAQELFRKISAPAPGPGQHRHFPVRSSLQERTADTADQFLRFFRGIPKSTDFKAGFLQVFPYGPDLFFKPVCIPCDHFPGNRNDLRPASEVLLQPQNGSIRVIVGKSEHDLRPGTAEPVY